MSTVKGKLYLIPNTLGNDTFDGLFPAKNAEIIKKIRFFIVEDIRTARRFLKKVSRDIVIDDLQFFMLNKHTDDAEISKFLLPATEGKDTGILSEAGTPCIADPGSQVVELAHKKNIRVIPMVGPNAIIMALMASGFNGQNFVFHGYLPVQKKLREEKIRALERAARQHDQTQIFIETPFRNMQMLESILKTCSPDTRICIASNITCNDEMIISGHAGRLRSSNMDIHKKPAVFLIYR